jgi:hypothetical protein
MGGASRVLVGPRLQRLPRGASSQAAHGRDEVAPDGDPDARLEVRRMPTTCVPEVLRATVAGDLFVDQLVVHGVLSSRLPTGRANPL